ncbi:MAG: RNA polymerase sigma factor [Chromatiaceae bacterium]|nr:RNA polymerase sigma factor [Chromatiaceae bacterium]
MGDKDINDFIDLLPKLRRFAYGLCGSSVVAEDLVQEAFTRLLSSDGREEQYMERWLFRIVRNLYVDLIRKEDIRDRHYEQSREFSGSDVDGAAQIENLITLSYVRELMEKLPTEHCEVLLLVAVEGYSYREAAEILDLPIGTITSRLARARSKLLNSYSGSEFQEMVAADSGAQ